MVSDQRLEQVSSLLLVLLVSLLVRHNLSICPNLGPSLWVSFLISGIITFASSLIYGEFASQLPFSGGGYAYAYASLGELPAWLIGWT